MDVFHKPVLLKEVIAALEVKKGEKYIDATIGGGGYTKQILERGGIVLGMDMDTDAISFLQDKFSGEKNLFLVEDNFINIRKAAEKHGFYGVSGIVFDLGISSHQIENSGRGFSFSKDEPLDMRMSRSIDITAGEIVNTWSREELYELFARFGEERFAKQIVNNISQARKIKPIKTSLELANIISEGIKDKRSIHPATKVFQALRIGVNSELANLKIGIWESFPLLKKGGRIVIVDFHSLEDRIVKQEFARLERDGKAEIITKKPIVTGSDELRTNRRARSAKMRAIKKI